MKINYLVMSIVFTCNASLHAINPSVNMTLIISYLLSDSSPKDRSIPHVFKLAQLAQNASLSPLEYLNKEFETKSQETFSPSLDTKLFSSYNYSSGAVYTADNWTSMFNFKVLIKD